MIVRDFLALAAPLLVGQGWRFSEELAVLLEYAPTSRNNLGKMASGQMEPPEGLLLRLKLALERRQREIAEALAECARSEHGGAESSAGGPSRVGPKALDNRRAIPHNAVMIQAERVSDSRDLQIPADRIRFGRPTRNNTLASALLRKTKLDGDATYWLPRPGAKFGEEIYIEKPKTRKGRKP